jgi:predicted RNase H-like nuclease
VRVLGVDGCPDGWVGAAWNGKQLTLHHASTLDALHATAGRPHTVAVDMPIGLLNTPRRADESARKFLGSKGSSVFPAPALAVLEQGVFDDYATANALNRRAGDRGLSRQSFGLLRKIAEVEAWRHTCGAAVHEVHPEVAFQLLAEQPLRASKKTWTGAGERRALLARAGLHPPEDVPLGAARVDDVLDACILAWSATRIAQSRHVTFPPDAAPNEPTIRA